MSWCWCWCSSFIWFCFVQLLFFRFPTTRTLCFIQRSCNVVEKLHFHHCTVVEKLLYSHCTVVEKLLYSHCAIVEKLLYSHCCWKVTLQPQLFLNKRAREAWNKAVAKSFHSVYGKQQNQQWFDFPLNKKNWAVIIHFCLNKTANSMAFETVVSVTTFHNFLIEEIDSIF
jgi:hypothetical protein